MRVLYLAGAVSPIFEPRSAVARAGNFRSVVEGFGKAKSWVTPL
jgi:hypothetical protein